MRSRTGRSSMRCSTSPPVRRGLRGGDRSRGTARAGGPDAATRARRMSRDGGRRRLLIRDISQLATPAGTNAPLRGAELGQVDVVEGAYVLCEDGVIAGVGRMQDLEPVDGDVEERDARGLCALPGLVDCHTHACFAGDRVEEFALRAAGASYEELHAAGGGILATVRATRAASEPELRR